ncbi:hypothetical protein FRC10_006097 [Ceratobasidium sp. 414]|nr:hypothetical protein FRC10_006097 [Ceratobasidium sp. 414]
MSTRRYTRSSGQNQPGNPNVGSPPPAAEPLTPEEALNNKCSWVLSLLEKLELNLGSFLCAIFYGNPASRAPEDMRAARASLLQTDCFSALLGNIYKPPKPPRGNGNTPTSGKNVLVDFAITKSHEIFATELQAFSKDYWVDKGTLADFDEMKTVKSATLYKEMTSKCPRLWKTPTGLGGDEDEPAVEGHEEDLVPSNGTDVDEDGMKIIIEPHPHFGTIMAIASLAYRHNRRKNKLQAILSVYVHTKHTNKSVHALLQQAGVTMSYDWTLKFIDVLAKVKHREAIAMAATRPILLAHDNLRLKFPVQSQRGEHQSVTDNGTGITMIALPDSARAFEDTGNLRPFFDDLRARRLAGNSPRLAWSELAKVDRLKRVKLWYITELVDIMRLIPGMSKSKVLKSDKLQRLPALQQLPHGKEHCTEMFVVPAACIDKSTYAGNIQVIRHTINYLGLLDDKAKRDRLAFNRKVVWVGDQMTSQRCNTAQSFLNECDNPIDRLEPFIFIYGGLHCEMALQAGTFEGSRGTTAGSATFARDVIRLDRTGFNTNMNKSRHDFHAVDEFLHHQVEARVRKILELETDTSETGLLAWVESHTPE